MTQDDIAKIIAKHRPQLRAMGVRSLALFGSYARREAAAESDIDFLVDFEGPATFDRYMELKLLLQDLFGRSVDLVTRAALREELRESVERDALNVA